MIKPSCHKCEYQGCCKLRGIFRRIEDLMLMTPPGQKASGGPGDMPWSYNQIFKLTIECNMYKEYNYER